MKCECRRLVRAERKGIVLDDPIGCDGPLGCNVINDPTGRDTMSVIDPRDKKSDESVLDWMARQSGDPKLPQAAVTIRRWLSQYPGPSRSDIEARLRNSSSVQVDGAILELYVHQLLQCLAPDSTVSVAPSTSAGSTPDFQVTSLAGKKTFIEATVYGHDHGEQVTDEQLRSLMREVRPYITVPGFHVWVDSVTFVGNRPPLRKVAAALNEWLASLDWDAVRAAFDDGDWRSEAVRRWESCLEFGGRWQIHATPFPASDRNTVPESLLGPHSVTEATWTSPVDALRKIIERKRRQHGQVTPLIIVACCNNPLVRPTPEYCMDAFIGSRVLRNARSQSAENDTVTLTRARSRDGLWTDARRTTGSVIGVMTISSCFPWNVPHDDVTLWLKPFLDIDDVLPGWPFSYAKWRKSDRIFELTRGQSVRERLQSA